ncbi:hypothetical protein JCM10212_003708 [Sporobolomyces blumeae]
MHRRAEVDAGQRGQFVGMKRDDVERTPGAQLSSPTSLESWKVEFNDSDPDLSLPFEWAADQPADLAISSFFGEPTNGDLNDEAYDATWISTEEVEDSHEEYEVRGYSRIDLRVPTRSTEESRGEGRDNASGRGASYLGVSVGPAEGDKSGGTDPDSFIDPLMVSQTRRHDLDHAALFPFSRERTTPRLDQRRPSPPRYDLDGRLLPVGPPGTLPLSFTEIVAYSTARYTAEPDLPFPNPFVSVPPKTDERDLADETIHSTASSAGRGYWDSTLDMTGLDFGDLTGSTSPSLPERLDNPRTVAKQEHLSPPCSSFPVPPTPPLPCSDSAPASPPQPSRQRLPTARLPTVSTSVPLESPPPIDVASPPSPVANSPLTPRTIINRSPDGFYRLPISPFSDTAFPLPPPPPTTASTSSFPYYVNTGGGESPSPSAVSTPPLPPPAGRAPVVPSFVSVFIDPSVELPSLPPASLIPLAESSNRPRQPLEGQTTARRTHPTLQSLDSVVDRGEEALRRSWMVRHRRTATDLAAARPSGGTPPIGNRREGSNDGATAVPGLPFGSDEGDRAAERARLTDSKRRTQRWVEEVVGSEKGRDIRGRSTDGTIGSDEAPSSFGKTRRKKVRLNATVWDRTREFARTKEGRWTLGGTALIVAIIVVVAGAVVGTKRGGDAGICGCENGGKASQTREGVCSCACSDAWGGTRCRLNASCVDPGGSGNSIAQGFVDVSLEASQRWEPSVNLVRLAATLRDYVSSPQHPTSSSSCKAQLGLLSFPTLTTYPARLAWTQSALAHTLASTESNATTYRFRTFANGLSFLQFGDEPASKPNSNFQIISGGFTFDFATMERTVQAVSWEDGAKPDEAERDVIDGASTARNALDRLTGFAIASSTQRSTALAHLWIDTLRFGQDDLDRFRSMVQSAELVVPYDPTVFGHDASISSALSGSSFAVGIGCLSGLSDEVVERISAVERDVFGLPAVSLDQSQDDTCLDRPTYGLRNPLHLSTPFLSSDPRALLPTQSIFLSPNVTPRVTVHAGEPLSAGSLAPAPTTPSSPATIEHFGLLSSHIDHVLFDYLSLIDSDTAKLLVGYVLSGSTEPSASTSDLSRATDGLSTLPVLEVQVWGGVRSSDIGSTG